MEFKTENYKLSYIENFPFNLHIESTAPIYDVSKSSTGICYTKNDYIEFISKNKKEVRFATEVTALDSNDKVMIGGDQRGIIKLFDYKKRILNHFDEHSDRINQIKMFDNTFLSGSNDTSARLFDFSRKESIFTCFHTDFVKSVDISENLIVTSSYNKNIFIFDKRQKEKIKEYKLDSIINKIAFYNGKVVVGSKFQLHTYDFINDCIENTLYAHTKDIAGLKIYDNKIYTSSYDGMLKSFDKNLRQISRFKFNDSILSFDINEDDIFVGLENGNVFNLIKEENEPEKEVKGYEVYKNFRYYHDKKDDVKKIKIDHYIKNEIEKLMNNNQHWLAFSKIFIEENIDIIYAVLMFIKEKKGLKNVLKDRSASEIIMLIDFMIDNFHINELRTIFLDILTIILSLYEKYFLYNIEIKEKCIFLNEIFENECAFQDEGVRFLGFVESYLLDN